MIRYLLTAATMVAIAAPATAMIVSIDFDTGTDGNAIGGFYAGQGVTFANAEFTSNFGLAGSSGDLGVRAPGTYAFGPGNAVTGTFSSAVSSVTVRGIDVGAAGIRLAAFDAFNNPLGSTTAFGPGIGVGYFFDVTITTAGIRSFAFSQDNPCCGDGVLFDNFSFTNGVPEPDSWALLIAGFGLTGATIRRRRGLLAA